MQFGIPLPAAFAGFIERLPLYLARIARLPIAWGIPGSEGAHGMPTRLFRYDHDRMKRMVLLSEHLIRCLIVWLAFLRLHYDKVSLNAHAAPLTGSKSTTSQRPMDERFSARALPLHPVKPPPFRVSMPAPSPKPYAKGSGLRTTTHAKRRYDDEMDGERLIQRADRLEHLIDTLLPRADRLAAYWAGRLKRARAPVVRDTDAPAPHNACSEPRDLIFDPLKSPRPPPDLLEDAEDDEAEDLSLLHDVAIDAAEGFNALCG
mgnify:CR=1 FL=1